MSDLPETSNLVSGSEIPLLPQRWMKCMAPMFFACFFFVLLIGDVIGGRWDRGFARFVESWPFYELASFWIFAIVLFMTKQKKISIELLTKKSYLWIAVVLYFLLFGMSMPIMLNIYVLTSVGSKLATVYKTKESEKEKLFEATWRELQITGGAAFLGGLIGVVFIGTLDVYQGKVDPEFALHSAFVSIGFGYQLMLAIAYYLFTPKEVLPEEITPPDKLF